MFDREIMGRVAQAEISVYDGILAEIYAEKERRMRKFERTHHADNSKKDDTPADRKQNKKIRMQKMYGLNAFEDTTHGKTVYYFDKKNGPKKFPEHEAEIFRNIKERSTEKSAYAEMIPEDVEQNVGKTTLSAVIKRTYYRMQKIAEEFRNQNGYRIGTELWAYDKDFFPVEYPMEYYNLRNKYIELCDERDSRFRRKLDRGNKYLRKFADVHEESLFYVRYVKGAN